MSTPYQLLSRIVEPNDLHKLSIKELQQVADELRQAILEHVCKTGGHVSSNLGVVELTVALYAAYSIPPDKVIWDTGHQAYSHKLLTGRLNRFDTLRQHGGLSGFLNRKEHELDFFGAGHAGTAISAALGFAAARDRLGGNERIVAVTGDAAISNGMCWEALNHAGGAGADIAIVLNDNRMSIGRNVGALAIHCARLRSRPLVQDLASRAKEMLNRIPGPAGRVAAGLKHGITHYFAPDETGTVFEGFGFEYIGPVDGHNIPQLLEIFRNLRELRGPLLVHAITTKGKGYEVAENDARKWHGVAPFDLDAGELPQRQGPITYTRAFGNALCEAARADDRIVAISAAMADGTGLAPFAEEFPTRYFDVGIAEEHAVTFAAGLAAGGMKPFCAIYSTFLQRGFDQILHDVCLQNLPVRFFLDRSGIVGEDGPTHHGAFDLTYLGCIPNLTLMAPRDATELGEMLRFSASYDEGPVAVRYPRGATDQSLPESRAPIALGKAEVLGCPLASKSPEVTIVAIGSTVAPAWRAARALADEGVAATVVNARFAKPLDVPTITELAEETGALVTVEENVRIGGFGQQVREALARAGLTSVRHELLALPDRFVEHGAQKILREEYGIDAKNVALAALRLVRPRNRAAIRPGRS